MFYLKPPRGQIHREVLLDLASKRLRVLSAASSAADYSSLLESCLSESEAVAEGSTKDRVAHFALALAAAVRGGLVREHIVAGEARLFRLRVNSLDSDSLEALLSQLQRHLKERLTQVMDAAAAEMLDAVSEVLDSGMLKSASPSTKVSVKVKYTLVLPLVRTRKVVLSEGLAIITSDDLPGFLESLHEMLIRDQVSTACFGPEAEDIADSIAEMFYSSASYLEDDRLDKAKHILLADKVPRASQKLFPPCMRYLQMQLSRCHRLQHHGRIAYTLFLKEVGMPLSEALAFWSGHLSQEAKSGHHSCSHSWQRDGRRYEYSVQFLYGRRGRMVDYSAHSCSTIRQRAGPTSQLFCPFHALRGRELKEHLNNSGAVADVSLSLASEDRCQDACAAHMARQVRDGSMTAEDFKGCVKPSHFARRMMGPS